MPWRIVLDPSGYAVFTSPDGSMWNGAELAVDDYGIVHALRLSGTPGDQDLTIMGPAGPAGQPSQVPGPAGPQGATGYTGAAGDQWAYAEKSTTYTALANDYIEADATSAAFTVTLPSAPLAGTQVAVKKIDASANIVTVVGQDSTTIDGDANATIVSQWAGATFLFNGTNWRVL